MAIDLHMLPNVWPAESLTRSREESICSGEPQLDASLGGGWPTPALIEILIDHYGIGELTVMMPLLKSLIGTRTGTMVLWINAPYALHAVALVQHGLDPACHWIVSDLNEREAAWAFEVALRSGACCAVIGWLQRPSVAVLRRLKLATSTGHTTGLLFRPGSAAATPSPATVRLSLTPQPPYLVAHLLKAQGRRQATLRLDLRDRLEAVSSP